MRPYDTDKLQELKGKVLRAKPLCENCKAVGIESPAAIVIHIKECRTYDSYFDKNNLESLCFKCYRTKSKAPLNLNKKQSRLETTPPNLKKKPRSFHAAPVQADKI